ncbi:MAG: hypothetical protein WC813_00630 [Patescibacteria group bacterium]|jgi:drug/metabolite transporter (DMT)-like permease
MDTGLTLCIISAIGISLWPLLARYAGVSQGWVSLLIFIPAAVVSLIINRGTLNEVPDKRKFALIFVCAVLDIIGLITFTMLLGGKYSFSGLMSTNVILILVVTSLGGILILGEPLTKEKIIGYILGAVAAWLLTKNSEG